LNQPRRARRLRKRIGPHRLPDRRRHARRSDLHGDRAAQGALGGIRGDVRALDDVGGEQEGTKEEAAYLEASVAADEALEEFLKSVPTTLAGLRAALEYTVEVDSGCVPDNGGLIAATLLRSPVFASMAAEELADV
jgi:hypothetical protein